MWRKFLILFFVAAVEAGSIFDAVNEDDPVGIMNAVADGADINEIGRGGQTPLLNAILTGKVEAVKALLDMKADYTIPEKDGYTVFHAAGFQGRAEIVKILANFQDEHGNYVIKDKFLMSKHSDGFYPIHRACWGRQDRHTETVKAFLDLGIDYKLRADDNKSCITMTKNQKTNKMLMKHAAKITSNIPDEYFEEDQRGDEL